MKSAVLLFLFVLVEIAVAVFILSTAGTLPEHVASHFNSAGMANGFMSRDFYVRFMLVFATGLPALVVISSVWSLRSGTGRINLPHREHWLSEAERERSIAFLSGHIACLGMLIALFCAWLHRLLIQINSAQPPQMPGELLMPGVAVFVACVVVWGVVMLLRFRRPS